MKNETEKTIELFRQYALKRLATHTTELELMHRMDMHGSANSLVLSRQQKQLFKAELTDKIRGLLTNPQNHFIKSELKSISNSLIKRLN